MTGNHYTVDIQQDDLLVRMESKNASPHLAITVVIVSYNVSDIVVIIRVPSLLAVLLMHRFTALGFIIVIVQDPAGAMASHLIEVRIDYAVMG
jgi:hypothetical protein